MPALAELQRAMAHALLGDPSALPAGLFALGPVPHPAALSVHRNTVLGGLVNALRLSCPTVLKLVGEDFFDQAAAAFAARNPPTRAALDGYGERFPGFLDSYRHTRDFPYLGDVARLDLAIDWASRASRLLRLSPLDNLVSIGLPLSLDLLWVGRPVDLIRAALADGDEEALSTIDLTLKPRRLAVWRQDDGVSVRALGREAWLFLKALHDGAAAETALVQASRLNGPEAALLAVQAEVFASPFAVIVPNPSEQDP